MSALEEKKKQYEVTLQTLRAKKTATIDMKVEIYRKQLLAEQTHEDEDEIQAVIDALMKVIDYENGVKE